MQPAMFYIYFHKRPCVKELVPRWGYRKVLGTLRRIFRTYWKVLKSSRMWIQNRIWAMHYSPCLRFASLTWGNKLFSTTYSHHDTASPQAQSKRNQPITDWNLHNRPHYKLIVLGILLQRLKANLLANTYTFPISSTKGASHTLMMSLPSELHVSQEVCDSTQEPAPTCFVVE